MTKTAAVLLALAVIITVGLILEFCVRCYEERIRWRPGPGWWFKK